MGQERLYDHNDSTVVHSSPKVMAVYLFLIFENFPIGGMFSILDTIWLSRSTTFSQNKKWCQMINPMCTAFKMWHNLIFSKSSFELIRFSKIYCILVKIFTPRSWHLYSISAMFHGNRASSFATVAHKFRPSVAFEWQYFLQITTISTTDAQRWRVVGTSVAGIKAAANSQIFDIPGRTVRGIRAR